MTTGWIGSQRLRRAAPATLLVAIALATYAGSLANGFVWDDEAVVVGNPDTLDLSRIGKVLLSPDETRPYYRPLNRASYLIDYRLFGMDPRGFHAINLALHAANVLLLFGLARRIFREPAPPFLAAVLLAVHPVHAEPVNFVTGRNNLFASLFILASLSLLVDARRGGSRLRAAASGLVFFLGLLSKEQAVMALPLMAAWLLLPGTFGEGARRRSLAPLAPHAVALLAYLGMRAVALGGPAAVGAIGQGLLSRLAQNYVVVPRYLGLVAFPRGLTIFHDAPAPGSFSDPWLLLAWAAVAAVVGLFLWRPSGPASFGLLWFGLHLLPIANLIPIPSALIAERYLYVPAVGLWLVAADGLRRLDRASRLRPFARVALAAIVVALAVRTAVRNLDWRDDQSLARAAVETNPRSAPARYNLGVVLKDKGDLAGARRQWDIALRLDPTSAQTLTQMGTLAAVSGDLGESERLLRRAIEENPKVAIAHFNLGKVCETTGRPSEALRHYEAYLQATGPRDAAFVPFAEERVRRLREAKAR